MENKKINFKDKIKNIFANKGKRHLATIVLILPFIIVIGFCGYKLYREAKGLIHTIGESGTEALNENYSILDGKYILRDTATDIQLQYFGELKDYLENNTGTPEEIACSIVKNFVSDFYTFSNKLGQYDVGGMYYLNGDYRKTIYIQARDQFYKYINNYINEYGAESLLEVENVEATIEPSTSGNKFSIVEINSETGESEEREYDYYNVKANWSYVQKDGNFNTNSFANSCYFVVINNDGRYQITYAGKEVYKQSEKETEEIIEE